MPVFYLLVISIITWGVGSVFTKVANNHMHPMMVTVLTVSTYLLTLPFIFIFFKFEKTVNVQGVLAALAGGILNGIGVIAYYNALKIGDAGSITTTTSLYPALTLLLSCAFLGETFSMSKVFGLVLACISFYFLNK